MTVSQSRTWTLLVDLTGGNFPGASSVVVTGDWDATPARIREMAAEHYGVPLSKVAWPTRMSALELLGERARYA